MLRPQFIRVLGRLINMYIASFFCKPVHLGDHRTVTCAEIITFQSITSILYNVVIGKGNPLLLGPDPNAMANRNSLNSLIQSSVLLPGFTWPHQLAERDTESKPPLREPHKYWSRLPLYCFANCRVLIPENRGGPIECNSFLSFIIQGHDTTIVLK